MATLNNFDPNRARFLIQKSKLLAEQQKFGDAIRAAKEAVEIDEKVLDPGHPYIDNAKRNLDKISGAASGGGGGKKS